MTRGDRTSSSDFRQKTSTRRRQQVCFRASERSLSLSLSLESKLFNRKLARLSAVCVQLCNQLAPEPIDSLSEGNFWVVDRVGVACAEEMPKHIRMDKRPKCCSSWQASGLASSRLSGSEPKVCSLSVSVCLFLFQVGPLVFATLLASFARSAIVATSGQDYENGFSSSSLSL